MLLGRLVFLVKLGALVVEFFRNLAEGIDDHGVEMLAGTFGNDGHGLFVGEGLLVDAFGHEGVEHVRDSHDSCRKRNRISLDSRGVAGAVPFFVVVMRHLDGFL